MIDFPHIDWISDAIGRLEPILIKRFIFCANELLFLSEHTTDKESSRSTHVLAPCRHA